MSKTLIVLILLFDGTLVKEKLVFDKPITILECLEFSENHREEIANHIWVKDVMKSGYYLNDGRGTLQGFICE
jgi:hypothetical protein|tara:strand:+ start:635 stop:853 length:219 start_codon:yes stop_codon:yes gene_type:complete